MSLAEDLISQCWRATVQPDLPFDKFPVLKFEEAFNNYGTDKPDTRFDMKVNFNPKIVNIHLYLIFLLFFADPTYF